MNSPIVQQATQGDADAIAHLMNQALQAKGITVYCERQESCLRIWLASSPIPAPTPIVNYLRRGLKRLKVSDIHSLQVYAYAPDPSIPGWGAEVSMAEDEGEVQAFPITAPTATDHDLEEATPSPVADLADPTAEAGPTADLANPTTEAEAVPPAVPPEAAAAPADSGSPDPGATAANPEAIAAASHHPMAAQYDLLELEAGTPLKAVSGQYFKLKALALKHGDRTRVEALKQAFYTLKDYLESNPNPSPPPAAANPSTPAAAAQADSADAENEGVVEQLETMLRQQRISAEVSLQSGDLQVSWLAVRVVNSEEVAEQLHAFLHSQDPEKLSQAGIHSLTVSSLTRDNTVVWQTSFPLEKSAAMKDPMGSIRRKVSLGLKR